MKSQTGTSVFRDVVSDKGFVGPCPWCYEPIATRYETSVEGLPIRLLVHTRPTCAGFIRADATTVLDEIEYLFRREGAA